VVGGCDSGSGGIGCLSVDCVEPAARYPPVWGFLGCMPAAPRGKYDRTTNRTTPGQEGSQVEKAARFGVMGGAASKRHKRRTQRHLACEFDVTFNSKHAKASTKFALVQPRHQRLHVGPVLGGAACTLQRVAPTCDTRHHCCVLPLLVRGCAEDLDVCVGRFTVPSRVSHYFLSAIVAPARAVCGSHRCVGAARRTVWVWTAGSCLDLCCERSGSGPSVSLNRRTASRSVPCFLDPSDTMQDLVSDLLAGRNVVFLTGAGISVASGIPPYRDSTMAVWSQFVEDWGTKAKFEKDPLDWWNSFWLHTHEKVGDMCVCYLFPTCRVRACAFLWLRLRHSARYVQVADTNALLHVARSRMCCRLLRTTDTPRSRVSWNGTIRCGCLGLRDRSAPQLACVCGRVNVTPIACGVWPFRCKNARLITQNIDTLHPQTVADQSRVIEVCVRPTILC